MSAWRSIQPSSRCCWNVLIGTATAPIRVVASHAVTHSGQFANRTPTRVPLPTPDAMSARARRADARSASPYESASPPRTMNAFDPCSPVVWRSSCGIVGSKRGKGIPTIYAEGLASSILNWLDPFGASVASCGGRLAE